MKIAETTVRDTNATELDIATIRRRVSHIKNQWTPEMAQARAAEGARRRRELDAMVTELLGEMRDEYSTDDRPSESDTHGLTLVG